MAVLKYKGVAGGCGVLAVFGVCALLAGSPVRAEVKASARRAVPSLPQIDLFQGIAEGQLEAKVIFKNAHAGNLLITNKSTSPLTVRLPAAFVAVHVLQQNIAPFGQANGAGQQQGQNQQAQAVGAAPNGNANGNNANNAGNNGPGFFQGMNFMSIEPERVIKVPLKGVCLAHGRPDPRPQMTYELRRLEDYTPDAALRALLNRFGEESLDIPTAQAATWHLTDNLTWTQLREKSVEHLGGVPDSPYFTTRQISAAEKLIKDLQAKVAKSPAVPAPVGSATK